MKIVYEIYNKDDQMIRSIEDKPLGVRTFEIESTCQRGKLGGYCHASQEMVARLVPLLNDPPELALRGDVPPVRYFAISRNEFTDADEKVEGKPHEDHVGECVLYRIKALSAESVEPLSADYVCRLLNAAEITNGQKVP